MNQFQVKKVDYAEATRALNSVFPPPQETTKSLRLAFMMALLSTTYYAETKYDIAVPSENKVDTKTSAEVLAATQFMFEGKPLGPNETIYFNDKHLDQRFWVLTHADATNIVVYHVGAFNAFDFKLSVAPDLGVVRQLCGVRELPLLQDNVGHLIAAAHMFKFQLGNDQESINLYARHPLDYDLNALMGD